MIPLLTQDILRSLLREETVNGAVLSRQLGVSRAAVSKAVARLKAAGFEIESRTNFGYRLVRTPDLLLPELIEPLISREGWTILPFDHLESTNTHAKNLADDGAADRTVVFADEQTGGRGRSGRSFVSKKGLGLYMSILLRPEGPAENLSAVTALTAVAVRRAILRVCRADAGIKWPNDLLLHEKKLCGILTELSIEAESGRVQYMVIGIGINTGYLAGDFPEELAGFCTSLALEGLPTARPVLAAAILDELDRCYSNRRFAEPAEYHAEYLAHCVTIGRKVRVITAVGSRTGTAIGLDSEYGLLIDFDDGAREFVRSGEVTVRGLYGYAP